MAPLRAVHAGSIRLTWEAGIEFTAEVGGSAWTVIDTLCGPPYSTSPPCEPEGVESSILALVLGAGWEVPLRTGRVGGIAVVPGVGLALLTYAVEGRETGRKTHDSIVQMEIGGGLRYVSPSLWHDRVHLILEGRATAGWRPQPGCEDCVDALQGAANRTMVTIGVSFGG